MSGQIDFPLSVDARGRTAATSPDDHIRDLIVQVLLTSPGERVMRPDFGAGLLAAVFEPGGPVAAESAQFFASAALERELGGIIVLEAVDVEAVDAALVVTVAYVARTTGAASSAVVRVETGA